MKDNMKRKVLLVSPYSAMHTGGIGTWSRIVLDYSETVDDVNLLFLNTATNLPKRQAMSNRLAHLLIGGIDSVRILLLLFWKMLTWHPDVIHYTSSAGAALRKDLIAIWIVKKLFGKKFIIHWHFGRIPTIFLERGKEYSLFLKVCRKADMSIPIDEKSYKLLNDAGLDAFLIPNPIPVSLQEEAEKYTARDLAESRRAGDVLFVGHMLKTKGLTELVLACSNSKEVSNLICVGPFFDESYRDELKEIAKNKDDGSWLQLTGEKSREEVWDYYKQCSIFCLPSYSEGLPYVVLEAMSFSCPIVATNVGAIPEMLSDDCGLLVAPKSVEMLKTALELLLTNKGKAYKIGINARSKVLKDYTVTKAYSLYKHLWENI